MKVIEVQGWGTYLRKQWENHLVNYLGENEKKKIYLHDEGGACGHIYGMCLLIRKGGCYVFYQHSNDVLIVENTAKLMIDDILEKTDIYIVDTDFRLTYVKTHETGYCGPYFSQKH